MRSRLLLVDGRYLAQRGAASSFDAKRRSYSAVERDTTNIPSSSACLRLPLAGSGEEGSAYRVVHESHSLHSGQLCQGQHSID